MVFSKILLANLTLCNKTPNFYRKGFLATFFFAKMISKWFLDHFIRFANSISQSSLTKGGMDSAHSKTHHEYRE
jgi:hypothetical protein